MKRLLIIAILAVAGSTAMAQTHQDKQQTSKEKTLYVIDGQVYSKDVFDKLAPDKIKDVKVLKGIGDAIVVTTRTGEMAGSSVLKIYGADEGAVEYSDPGNKDKTIVIGTKPDPKKAAKNTIVTRSIDQAIQALQQRKEELAGCNVEVKILPRQSSDNTKGESAKPLIVVKDNKGETSAVKSYKDIKPDDIKSITIYKNDKAQQFQKYGDISNGVTFIELK